MTTLPSHETGFALGTGAAINIQLGFVPDIVHTFNVAGTTPTMNVWYRQKFCVFTSGGTGELVPGNIIQGATATQVRAMIRQVILSTGTWAGGDAAGWLLWTEEDQNGSFGTENVDLLDTAATVEDGGGTLTANVAGVVLQSELAQWDIDTAVIDQPPTTGLFPYVGTDAGDSKGFTIGTDVSVSGEVIAWHAWRNSS